MNIVIDSKTYQYPQGTDLVTIAGDVYEGQSPVMAAEVDGRFCDLSEMLTESCKVTFITLQDMEGFRVFVRTLSFTYLVALHHIVGTKIRLRIMHSISGNVYTELRESNEPEAKTLVLSEEQIAEVNKEMNRLIRANLPIERRYVHLLDAMKMFRENDMPDMERLFSYRSTLGVNLYFLDGEFNYFYGGMAPSTGYLWEADYLVKKGDGIMLRMPSRVYPHELRTMKEEPGLFEIFKESKNWCRLMGVEDVGALNDTVSAGKITELIQTSEALHAKKIAQIATQIASRPSVRLVLIAGPSSSGKTTFAQRLMVQLRAEGFRPHLISMDNYFLSRRLTPLDEDGKPDFECLAAVNTDQFNKDMTALLAGETVEIPVYNFITGETEYPGKHIIKLEERDILIVEGIHCLNEEVSKLVPKENKFKIYISALAFLNVDDHNRIQTTDGRLLRRIIRDNQHRGYSAAKTISMWTSVRKGEEKNIFPYQNEADAMFNSAHIYELAVIKQFAEPLLYQIKPDQPEYAEARRLIKFLDYFLGVSPEAIPRESLLREFIGGGVFEQ